MEPREMHPAPGPACPVDGAPLRVLGRGRRLVCPGCGLALALPPARAGLRVLGTAAGESAVAALPNAALVPALAALVRVAESAVRAAEAAWTAADPAREAAAWSAYAAACDRQQAAFWAWERARRWPAAPAFPAAAAPARAAA